ncbi:hypothetical protein BJ741DRAFT_49146 [Chytriomyces cf. hyalinus JEL632]|nr:hypothetical protein BJ741DRAFT_49146 [Chytriomyces cf. hyalinus JEL632]
MEVRYRTATLPHLQNFFFFFFYSGGIRFRASTRLPLETRMEDTTPTWLTLNHWLWVSWIYFHGVIAAGSWVDKSKHGARCYDGEGNLGWAHIRPIFFFLGFYFFEPFYFVCPPSVTRICSYASRVRIRALWGRVSTHTSLMGW